MQVSISQRQQTVAVAFVPGTRAFSTASFRRALGEANVEIDRLDIDACGVVDERDGKRWLAAAANRFLLAGVEAPRVGANCVTGRLNDRVDPHELEVIRSRPTTDP
jgi:hypothetical protein